MAFSKTFPRTLKGSTYPIWEEITLDDKEEKEIDRSLPLRYFKNIGFSGSFV